jgi:aminopeptidase N
MRLPLTDSLLPGEQVVVQLDFVTTVPLQTGRNYGVFAYVEDILALAHFYPQVAVYDEQGWHLEPAAEGGDVTYADVGFYLVRVTVPAELVIAAGGIEVAREETADSQTMTYAAGPMRDFYLAASERYEVISQTIGEITINSYAPPEYALGSTSALTYALNAIESFSGRFAPYPYTELDIVTTPTLALGIEYPGIIANRLAMYGSRSGNLNRALLESTTVHEVGHQWFYSLVGNNQLAEPWLDEALTQYVTYLYYLDHYGADGAQEFYESLHGRWYAAGQAEIPIGLPVSAYSGAEYGAIVYGRGPIFFAELANIMGQENFDHFLRDYTITHKWGIATSQSLKETAEIHCSCDLTPLFVDWVYE